MKSLLMSIFLILAVNVNAETIRMAVITSEFDKNVTDFYLETDSQNKIHSMRYVTTMPDGGIFEDVTLSPETVMAEGAVIVVRNGREAVKLFVEDFSLITGGTIKLNYLFSGLTNTWHTKRLKLNVVANSFRLFDLEGKITNKLFMKINWNRIFGAVGIREIQTTFSPELVVNSSNVLSAH